MVDEGLDLRVYLRLLRKWWWVFVIGVIAVAIPAGLVARNTTPEYEARVRVLVQGAQGAGLPSAFDLANSEGLADTSSELIKIRPVLARVSEEINNQFGSSYGSGSISGKLSISSPGSFIEIKARDPDPVIAAAIANLTTQAFIEDFQNRQLTQIARFQASLSQFGIEQDPSISSAQAALFGFFTIVEEALPPGSPQGIPTRRNIILGAILGLFAAVLVVFLLEYLDDRIKTPDELKERTGLPVFGTLPFHKGTDGRRPVLFDDDEDRHRGVADAYLFLGKNLEFASLGSTKIGIVVVSSSVPLEGKTTTAANLAIAWAKSGKSVILVDCDLHRPALRQVFDLPEHPGLTDLLLGDTTMEAALVSTSIEGLKILQSGPLPPDPSRALGSPEMKQTLEQLERQADIVIIDTPPVLPFVDTLVLAPLVAAVIVVVDTSANRRQLLGRTLETLQQARPSLLGTVMNKMPHRGSDGYNYGYYGDYYSENRRDGSRLDGAGLFARGKLLGLTRAALGRMKKRWEGTRRS